MSISDSLKELGKTVAKYAPLLGAVIPVPGGAAIGSAIAALFNGDIDNPGDLIKKINSDPEAEIKLQKFKMEHEEEIVRLIVEDKKSARNREIEFIKATGKEDRTLKNLAYITTVGFFAVLIMILSDQIQVDSPEKDIVMVFVGILTSKWQTIVDYFFGSAKQP